MKKIFFCLLLVFVLVVCINSKETPTTLPIGNITQPIPTVIFLTKTSSPTPSPLPTIPIATLNSVATLDATRIDLINKIPELEKYGASCYKFDCSGIGFSPNQQIVFITNGNTIELFNLQGERIGKYSFYDLYGYLINYGDGYLSIAHWSEDEKYLYVTSQFGDGGPEAYFGYKSSLSRVNLENGTWKDTGISGVISFSPNEKYIVYSTDKSEIKVRDLQSGEESLFFSENYYLYFGEFVWYSDNKKIVFTATPEDWYTNDSKFALYIIDLESKTITNVYETTFPFYYPVSWIEENKIILNNFQEFGEWLLDLSSNPPEILTSQ